MEDKLPICVMSVTF